MSKPPVNLDELFRLFRAMKRERARRGLRPLKTDWIRELKPLEIDWISPRRLTVSELRHVRRMMLKFKRMIRRATENGPAK